MENRKELLTKFIDYHLLDADWKDLYEMVFSTNSIDSDLSDLSWNKLYEIAFSNMVSEYNSYSDEQLMREIKAWCPEILENNA